jgi:hypothetical protein
MGWPFAIVELKFLNNHQYKIRTAGTREPIKYLESIDDMNNQPTQSNTILIAIKRQLRPDDTGGLRRTSKAGEVDLPPLSYQSRLPIKSESFFFPS